MFRYRQTKQLPDHIGKIPEGYKRCEGRCGEILLIAEHFHKDAGTDDKHKSTCKKCRLAARQEQRGRRLQKVAKRMDQKLIRALDAVSRTTKPSGIHVCDLTEEVLAILGNSYGLAQQIVQQLTFCAPGSPTKTRMLEMLVRLVTKNSEMGNAQLQLDNMTVEELDALYQKRVEERARQLLKLNVLDAEVVNVDRAS